LEAQPVEHLVLAPLVRQVVQSLQEHHAHQRLGRGYGGRPPLLRSARGQALSTAAAIAAKSISSSAPASVCTQPSSLALHCCATNRSSTASSGKKLDGVMRGGILPQSAAQGQSEPVLRNPLR
jgi:hypothetical protein